MENNNQPYDPNKSMNNIYVPAAASIISILFGLYRYSEITRASETYYPGFYKVFWFERLFVNQWGSLGIPIFWVGLGVIMAIIAGIFFYRIKIKK